MWPVFATLSAFASGTRNVLSKFTISRYNEYVGMWVTALFSLLCSATLVLLNGFVISDQDFWKFMLVRVVVDVIAFITFFKALKYEGVSYVIPLLSFVPAISTVSAFFINGQRISPLGIVGIAVICVGNLLIFLSELNLKKGKVSKDLLKATIFILITIFGWALVDPIHKEGIDRSSPYTYYFVGSMFFAPIFTILAFVNARKDMPKAFTKKNILPSAALGLLLGVEFASQLVALTGTFTAYVSAIKSTNIIVSSGLAKIFLKEKIKIIKAFGILVSVSGVLVLIFS